MTLVRKMQIYRYLRGDNCYIIFNKKPTPKGELGCGCTIIVFFDGKNLSLLATISL